MLLWEPLVLRTPSPCWLGAGVTRPHGAWGAWGPVSGEHGFLILYTITHPCPPAGSSLQRELLSLLHPTVLARHCSAGAFQPSLFSSLQFSSQVGSGPWLPGQRLSDCKEGQADQTVDPRRSSWADRPPNLPPPKHHYATSGPSLSPGRSASKPSQAFRVFQAQTSSGQPGPVHEVWQCTPPPGALIPPCLRPRPNSDNPTAADPTRLHVSSDPFTSCGRAGGAFVGCVV